jgi:hypothetical protein
MRKKENNESLTQNKYPSHFPCLQTVTIPVPKHKQKHDTIGIGMGEKKHKNTSDMKPTKTMYEKRIKKTLLKCE